MHTMRRGHGVVHATRRECGVVCAMWRRCAMHAQIDVIVNSCSMSAPHVCIAWCEDRGCGMRNDLCTSKQRRCMNVQIGIITHLHMNFLCTKMNCPHPVRAQICVYLFALGVIEDPRPASSPLHPTEWALGCSGASSFVHRRFTHGAMYRHPYVRTTKNNDAFKCIN